ncbi:MAG: protein phosphatase 2C domain-containing protein [Armatimonadetes bacterium]|nr:protein phosphatase 2C domain-containing protein [Armatimonadota bacterium]
MRILVEGLWLPKAGHSEGEYEDALSHRKTQGKLTKKAPRFAVADGATESSFSGVWARLLVNSNSRAPLNPANVRQRVEGLGRKWFKEATARPLPWYAERKIQQGAFSTFLGLSLENDVSATGRGTWTAFAIGDSCLFQVRDTELVTCFPIGQADQFGYHPLLLSSIPQRNDGVWEKLSELEKTGVWLPGDTFFLMTDALAQWFLVRAEQENQPWLTLKQFIGQSALPLFSDQFEKWVNEMRDAKEMRNDDVTLLTITIEEP